MATNHLINSQNISMLPYQHILYIVTIPLSSQKISFHCNVQNFKDLKVCLPLLSPKLAQDSQTFPSQHGPDALRNIPVQISSSR